MPLNKFRRIGEIEGSSKDIRFLIGSSEDALRFFEVRVVSDVTSVIKSDGQVVKIGYDKFGNKIVYRTYSSTHGSFHTLDLYKKK